MMVYTYGIDRQYGTYNISNAAYIGKASSVLEIMLPILLWLYHIAQILIWCSWYVSVSTDIYNLGKQTD